MAEKPRNPPTITATATHRLRRGGSAAAAALPPASGGFWLFCHRSATIVGSETGPVGPTSLGRKETGEGRSEHRYRCAAMSRIFDELSKLQGLQGQRAQGALPPARARLLHTRSLRGLLRLLGVVVGIGVPATALWFAWGWHPQVSPLDATARFSPSTASRSFLPDGAASGMTRPEPGQAVPVVPDGHARVASRPASPIEPSPSGLVGAAPVFLAGEIHVAASTSPIPIGRLFPPPGVDAHAAAANASSATTAASSPAATGKTTTPPVNAPTGKGLPSPDVDTYAIIPDTSPATGPKGTTTTARSDTTTTGKTTTPTATEGTTATARSDTTTTGKTTTPTATEGTTIAARSDTTAPPADGEEPTRNPVGAVIAHGLPQIQPGHFLVLVGTFADPGTLERYRRKIVAAGLPARTRSAEGKSPPQTHLQVGPFPTRDDARKVAAYVRKKTGLPATDLQSRFYLTE
ncbi:MAG: SPOR domain-containing protein [Magnetococcales bacterium]|nr:SPOR domain-containing protein [Magnetococcales bacterium]